MKIFVFDFAIGSGKRIIGILLFMLQSFNITFFNGYRYIVKLREMKIDEHKTDSAELFSLDFTQQSLTLQLTYIKRQ